jgi:hypothetical protein
MKANKSTVATTNKTKPKAPIDVVLVHEGAHADENLGGTLFIAYGEELYPGASSAKVFEHSFGGGVMKPEDQPANVVLIGMGGGEFDEHGKPGNHCAATLVAQKLGLLSNQALAKITLQTLIDDNHASLGQKNTIPFLIKAMNDAEIPFEETFKWYQVLFWAEYRHQQALVEKGKFNQEYQDVLNYMLAQPERINLRTDPWAKRIIAIPQTTLESGYELIKADKGETAANDWKVLPDLAMAKRQEDFLAAEKEWLANGKRETLETDDGDLRIGFIESDLTQMHSAARFCRPDTRWAKVDLFVQKKSAGHIQIFTDVKLKINLTDLARNIRLAEAKKRGVTIKDVESLSMEETHPEIPQWHLPKGNPYMLLNSSLSAKCVEPTILTKNEVRQGIIETFRRKQNVFPIDQRAFRPAKPVNRPDPKAFVPNEATRSLEMAFTR